MNFTGERALVRGESDVIINKGLATPESVAVDWIADRVYIVESELDQIEVTDLNGQQRTVIISDDLASPRAIAVDPRYG